ncbi:hypothetical protein IAR50_002353 [Cryptococcus sp. DSM 104548]
MQTNIRAPIPKLKSGVIPYDSLIPALYDVQHHPISNALMSTHAPLPEINRIRDAFLVHKRFDVAKKVDNGAGTFVAKKTPWIKWNFRVEIRLAKAQGYYGSGRRKCVRKEAAVSRPFPMRTTTGRWKTMIGRKITIGKKEKIRKGQT